MLLSTVVSQVINIGNNDGQSAYGDDWNDMSAFRQDIKDMGIETKSLVSSPLLLADIEDPANTTFIIAGVERDTLSLPQFSSDGFLTFAAEDGYTPAEVEAIKEFVFAGGDVLVMDDFGYSSSIAEAFGVRFKGVQLYDTVYVTELDYNSFGCVSKNHRVVWMEPQSTLRLLKTTADGQFKTTALTSASCTMVDSWQNLMLESVNSIGRMVKSSTMLPTKYC